MGIHITFPPNNGIVPPTFQVTGTVDNFQPAPTAVIGQVGGNPIAGIPKVIPTSKSGFFAIEFDNVPPGTGYTVTVFQGGPQTGVSVTGLTVKTP